MDDKRQRILEAARKRFRYYGVKKTAMQEIADDARVAVGTLYLYFKDKDDLLVACTEEYIDKHRRQAESILNSDAAAGEKLRRYIVGRFRADEATRRGYGHAAELTREVLRVRPERRLDEGQMMFGYFVRILQMGVDAGELHVNHPQRDARVLLLSLAFLFPSALDERTYQPKEEDLHLVVDWFLRAWGQANAGRIRSRPRVSQGRSRPRDLREA
jgi:AcrR family transcriptional regulator